MRLYKIGNGMRAALKSLLLLDKMKMGWSREERTRYIKMAPEDGLPSMDRLLRFFVSFEIIGTYNYVPSAAVDL